MKRKQNARVTINITIYITHIHNITLCKMLWKNFCMTKVIAH